MCGWCGMVVSVWDMVGSSGARLLYGGEGLESGTPCTWRRSTSDIVRVKCSYLHGCSDHYTSIIFAMSESFDLPHLHVPLGCILAHSPYTAPSPNNHRYLFRFLRSFLLISFQNLLSHAPTCVTMPLHAPYSFV